MGPSTDRSMMTMAALAFAVMTAVAAACYLLLDGPLAMLAHAQVAVIVWATAVAGVLTGFGPPQIRGAWRAARIR